MHLERDLIRERVSAGIRNARAKGTRFGRPMGAVDPDRILQMRGEGQSLRQIAETLGVGYGTVRERLKNGERKTPPKTDRERATIKDT
jgi:DNA invertase Pin-like site-specific DNA recombinase